MELSTTARNAAADAVVDLLDSGDIRFENSSNNEVATCNFGATAFGAASGGTATANTITDDSSATGGTIDHASIRNSGGTEVIAATCSATGGGGDIELTSLIIGAGDTVAITSFSYTQPAS